MFDFELPSRDRIESNGLEALLQGIFGEGQQGASSFMAILFPVETLAPWLITYMSVFRLAVEGSDLSLSVRTTTSLQSLALS